MGKPERKENIRMLQSITDDMRIVENLKTYLRLESLKGTTLVPLKDIARILDDDDAMSLLEDR